MTDLILKIFIVITGTILGLFQFIVSEISPEAKKPKATIISYSTDPSIPVDWPAMPERAIKSGLASSSLVQIPEDVDCKSDYENCNGFTMECEIIYDSCEKIINAQ